MHVCMIATMSMYVRCRKIDHLNKQNNVQRGVKWTERKKTHKTKINNKYYVRMKKLNRRRENERRKESGTKTQLTYWSRSKHNKSGNIAERRLRFFPLFTHSFDSHSYPVSFSSSLCLWLTYSFPFSMLSRFLICI